MELELDKLATCPELTVLEKRARNMTARNMVAQRTGRPLDHGKYSIRFPERANSDISKVVFAVKDKANFAAMVPQQYPKDKEGYSYFDYGYHGKNAGEVALLQRELRFTFPDTSQGFAEYASYAWTHLFKDLGASSIIQETDATGTIVGNTGFWGTSRDFLKLTALFLENGKWHGKQILPKELIDRHHNCPWENCYYRDGWWFYTTDGMPNLYYYCTYMGCIWIYPDVEVAALTINAKPHQKRFDDLYWQHHVPWINKQMKLWADAITTTTTTTTTTVPTTTTTMASTTTTVTSSTTATSTSPQTASPGSGKTGHTDGASNSNGNDEEPVPLMGTAGRNTSPLWMAISFMLTLRLSC